jgi:hypothetical protein
MSEGAPFVVGAPGLGRAFPFTLGGATFRVRHTTPAKLRQLREGIGLPAWPPEDERLTDRQRQALREAVLDWTIEGWEGVVGPDGEPLPCTLEHKLRAVDDSSLLDERLGVWAGAAYFLAQKEAQDELGNLRRSLSHGGTPSRTVPPAMTDAAARSDAMSVGASER